MDDMKDSEKSKMVDLVLVMSIMFIITLLVIFLYGCT